MELNFVKKSVYQQKLESDGVGEKETELQDEVSDIEQTRPEWKLLKDSNFRSLHDQIKQDESLKDGFFGAQQLERNTISEDDAKAPLFYGSDLVDRPESRLEEKEQVEAFQRERMRMIADTSVEEVSTPGNAESRNFSPASEGKSHSRPLETHSGSGKKRPSFFKDDEAESRKKHKAIALIEGYDDDDESD